MIEALAITTACLVALFCVGFFFLFIKLEEGDNDLKHRLDDIASNQKITIAGKKVHTKRIGYPLHMDFTYQKTKNITVTDAILQLAEATGHRFEYVEGVADSIKPVKISKKKK